MVGRQGGRVAVIFGFFRALRRRRLARRPMPEGWEALARARFPFVRALPGDEAARFFLHLKLFGLGKHFEGARGLVVTDEMKVVVAGAAARLSRNLSPAVYDDLQTVLLYEGAWTKDGGAGGQTLGEAHRWGLVVLAWDSVRRGLANPGDGHDTALHEFAHVLDLGDGSFDGTPPLHEWADVRAWARVFHRHYSTLRERPNTGVLRAYGATNEAEFFAVATEAFFEKPRQLKARAPELYAELKRYYRLDPVVNAKDAAPPKAEAEVLRSSAGNG